MSTIDSELLEALKSGTGSMTGKQIVALIMLHGLVSNPYTRGDKPGSLVRVAFKLADSFFDSEALLKEAKENDGVTT